MRILIIEDDTQVQTYVAKGLEETGHTVDCTGDGSDGLFMATTQPYDVLIVDRMLPALDGLTLVRTLRGAGNDVPVLILSALGEVDDRVTGLRAGGDDYLVKPFAFAELLARVEVLSKRRQVATGPQTTRLTTPELDVNLLSRKVVCRGTPVELQPREFRLLEYLLQHRGQVVTRTMLLEAVWDYHFDPQTNVIDVHISRLRKKLGDADNSLIKTIRGAGYIID